MPLYRYECTEGHVVEEFRPITGRRDPLTCGICGSGMRLTVSAAKPIVFRAGFYEHVSYEGVHAETPEQLRRACEEHGGISTYLENSIFRGNHGQIKEV